MKIIFNLGKTSIIIKNGHFVISEKNKEKKQKGVTKVKKGRKTRMFPCFKREGTSNHQADIGPAKSFGPDSKLIKPRSLNHSNINLY